MVLTGCRVGEIYPGGYSQLVKVKSEFLIKKPKLISNKNAMILGTAGFTSLLCAFAIKAREEILLGEKVNRCFGNRSNRWSWKHRSYGTFKIWL